MVKSPEKLRRQMSTRGWTVLQIEEAITSGFRYKTINRETGGPATRFVHPQLAAPLSSTMLQARCSMSEGTISDTETVYVRLLEEGVDVWRPVPAVWLGGDVFELSDAPIPEDEVWEFAPGSRVIVKIRQGAPDDYPVAVAVAEPTAVLAPAAVG